MILPPFLLARLKEPSSYAGLGALLGAFGLHIDHGVLQATIQLIAAVAGLIAVLTPESGGRSAP